MFEDLSNACDAVAAQMQDAAIYTRRGDARAAYAPISSAIELLRKLHSETGRKSQSAAHAESEVRVRGALPGWRIRPVVEHIELRLGEPIRVQELARIAGFSNSYFCRAFKARFGVTVHGYVTGRRMQMAQHYMLTTSRCLTEIALCCGMADQSHLTRIFRREFGEPPAQWRRARMYMATIGVAPVDRSDIDAARWPGIGRRAA